MFTSDHGGIESLQNHHVGTVPDSPLNSENAPLRGEKNTLWEGGMRACAFANWPGRLEPRKSPRLYNLLADPFETTDRAAQDPTVVAEYLPIAGADAALDLDNAPADLRVEAP